MGRLSALSFVGPDVFNGRGAALTIVPRVARRDIDIEANSTDSTGSAGERLNRIATRKCDAGFAPIVRFQRKI